jgi:hypothetical protein
MAFGTPVVVGSANSKTGTTLVHTLAVAVPAGSLCVVCVASDNAGTTDLTGADDISGVADNAGNGAYTLATGFRNGQGSAATGAHASIWYKVTTNAIPIGGTITITNTTTTRARACHIGYYPRDFGSTISVAGSAGAAGDAGVDPSAAISALASAEYLFVGCAADENNVVPGAAAGFTTLGTATTTGSTAQTNMAVGHYYSIFTGTAKTFVPATAVDAAAAHAAFKETLAARVGNLAATETGSDTAAFTGTVTATGNLAATETGSDTAAFVGSALSTIVGDFAAQEAGSDTAVFTGTVPIAGTLAATETGPDTAAFTGTVPIAAGLAAIESGSDTATLNGNVNVAGTLAATEAGPDTAVFNGTIAVIGSLAATETGEDTAVFVGDAAITGTIAAVEIGADTAAFVGSIEAGIEGSLVATESGADSATFVGAVPIAGSLAVTEGAGSRINPLITGGQPIGGDTADFNGFVEGAPVEEEETNLGTSVTRFEERRHKPKRKPLTLTKPLTEKQVQQLKDKVHEKRQAIWKRPVKEPTVTEPARAFIQSDKGELEATKTAVAIAQARVELEKLREQRKAEVATREAEVVHQRKERLTRLKKDIDEKKQKAMQLAIRNQEAVVALLLAA